jgi:hypothetical protein
MIVSIKPFIVSKVIFFFSVKHTNSIISHYSRMTKIFIWGGSNLWLWLWENIFFSPPYDFAIAWRDNDDDNDNDVFISCLPQLTFFSFSFILNLHFVKERKHSNGMVWLIWFVFLSVADRNIFIFLFFFRNSSIIHILLMYT